ncbi:MAG TPA: hypothetical protein VMJ30_03870 [Gemmatimonadales bacterium]|nr:hypothetical protein [Gemmatimonadales bacterium]
MPLLQVVVQVPPPPAPPEIVVSHGNAMPAEAIAVFVLVSIVATTLLLWPLIRAFARRIEGKNQLDPAMQEELEQLRQRVAQLEELPHRVMELEERADFAERLLTQSREPERLPGRNQT